MGDALNFVPVPDCVDTFVAPLAGNTHELLVYVKPGGTIPNHSHTCVSGMSIVFGTAIATKESGDVAVKPGDFIQKQPGVVHGFKEIGAEGLLFISTSDGEGILHPDNSFDFALN